MDAAGPNGCCLFEPGNAGHEWPCPCPHDPEIAAPLQYHRGHRAPGVCTGSIADLRQRFSAQARQRGGRFRQLDYEYEMSIEERKLRILEAYNSVLQALATLKAKSDAAALYNAQMKISEQDFINGKIDIISLSMERGRRSGAVISYQEGRATLHNAVTLLEMLTNIKIINR